LNRSALIKVLILVSATHDPDILKFFSLDAQKTIVVPALSQRKRSITYVDTLPHKRVEVATRLALEARPGSGKGPEREREREPSRQSEGESLNNNQS
jgi:hypothetical protein